jgi:hypothetical protein
MAEATQYSVSLRDMVELIIKSSDVHEGKWGITVGLQMGPGNFGATPDQSFPGASIAVINFGIQRVTPGTPVLPGAIVVDAAEINPKPKTSK